MSVRRLHTRSWSGRIFIETLGPNLKSEINNAEHDNSNCFSCMENPLRAIPDGKAEKDLITDEHQLHHSLL